MCAILKNYAEQGYDMTLRQLYYQLVAKDEIPNNQKQYDRLSTIVSEARRAGLIDWNLIVDRTRYFRELPHWNCPDEIKRQWQGGLKLLPQNRLDEITSAMEKDDFKFSQN